MTLTAKEQKAYDDVLSTCAQEIIVSGQIVADTTNMTTGSIETNMDTNQGWLIYGMEWWFDSDTTHLPINMGETQPNAWRLEVIRDDNNNLTDFLAVEDDRVLAHKDLWFFEKGTPVGGPLLMEWPIRVGYRLVTTAKHLRVMFMTINDETTLAATDKVKVRIFYDIVTADNEQATKRR